MTKNTSTPTNPPRKPGTARWPSTTRRTATPRRPSTSGRNHRSSHTRSTRPTLGAAAHVPLTRVCGATADVELRPDGDGRAVEPVERGADLHRLPDEDRRVALGVAGRLALAQRQHQVHEVRRLVALEDRHELLVVDPERVGRVVVDRRVLAADADVLVHRALAVLGRERVPRPQLHERA